MSRTSTLWSTTATYKNTLYCLNNSADYQGKEETGSTTTKNENLLE